MQKYHDLYHTQNPNLGSSRSAIHRLCRSIDSAPQHIRQLVQLQITAIITAGHVTVRAICFADYHLFRGLRGSDSTTPPPPHLPAKRGETLSDSERDEWLRVRDSERKEGLQSRLKPMSRSTPPAACLRDLCFTGYNGKIQFILRWLQHPIGFGWGNLKK